MIPRGVLLVALERCGFSPNEVQRVMAAVDAEMGDGAGGGGEWEEPDLSACPGCGGPADNGHDRCIPPSPYFCTKCSP